jgi:hypothetical protein
MTALRTALLAGAALTAGTLLAVPSAASATTPACGNNSLHVTATREDGATGHANFVLLFENVSKSPCTIHGYPGLDALKTNGTVLAHAKRTVSGFTGGSKHGVPTVLVKRLHFASADVEWMNFNPTTGGDCRFSHSVATTPANTAHAVHIARSVSDCRLQVHPTVAGKTGNG